MKAKTKFTISIPLKTYYIFTILIQAIFTSLSRACTNNNELTGTVVLGKSAIGEICTLIKIVDDKRVTPVGRSYNGRNWESFLGDYSSLKYSCNDYACSVTLPSLEASSYYKVSKVSHSLSRKDEFARFLEKSSFGPTKESLTQFDPSVSVDDNIANWIQDQIKNQMTLHREWFRLRANHRSEINHIARTYHACEKNTRYRRFAFTSKDFKKFVQVRSFKGKRILSVGGFTRTIVDSFEWTSEGRPLKTGTYMICRPIDCLNCTLSILDPVAKRCESVKYNGINGNPPIYFHESIELPKKLVQLPKDHVVKINEQYFPNGTIQEVMLVKELNDALCRDIASRYDNVPVFGFHQGTNEYYIHDPPTFLLNNTLFSPLADGGGHSKSFTNNATLCSNAPRTFLNSEYCQLSTEPSTCGPASVGPNTVVCGSHGEVANSPNLGGQQSYGGFDLMTNNNSTTWGPHLANQCKIIWTMVSLGARDQLRQRMAWALNQIFAIAASNVSTKLNTEMQTMYYDIFVRNAFGNYRDILREISYTVVMADSLSFKNSLSTAYNLDRFRRTCQPDENFAREVMQLFTVGPCKLNIDGTPVNVNDECVPTYTNDDIAEYSRAWTGFTPRELRGNIEAEDIHNHIDPMRIEVEWRDMFPKMGMDGKYIGDKYPRCSDRPMKHFLKKGARYVLLGRSSSPSEQYDPIEWEDDPNAKRIVLQKPSTPGDSSFLYTNLCSPDNNGNCQYRATVELTSNLNCAAEECLVDTVRVVEVNPGIYYSYIHTPCVERAFYENALKLNRRWSDKIVCADPQRELASSACCERSSDSWSDATRSEKYWGERMTYNQAKLRCEAIGKSTCKFPSLAKDCVVNGKTKPDCLDHGYYWTDASCEIKMKVNPDDGRVAIVHDPGNSVDKIKLAPHVRDDTLTFFRVHWENGIFPTPSNRCGNSSFCSIYNNMCICEVTVNDSTVFNSMPRNKEQVLNLLHIGSYDPQLLNLWYNKKSNNGIIMHHESKKEPFKTSSVFEVKDSFGVTRYLLNVKSIVSVKGTDQPKLCFRNPPQFLSIHDAEVRDAQFETEATLDHYFYHENTAPFVARKLINRFQISNPSPTYITNVAGAFTSGIYRWKTLTFGSKKYGDLAATISAILLDDESRLAVLDADVSYGSFREPILKVLSFMRSMEFKADDDNPMVNFNLIQEKIGQMAYEMESVFSFFLSDYELPNEPSLVAPEAQKLNGPNIVGTLNGLFSLIKWGATDYWDGFFQGRGGLSKIEAGNFNTSVGRLTFKPSSEDSRQVIDELSTLLTSGRLSSENKEIILNAYNQQSNKAAALMIAQQLITTTSEFHSTGLARKSGKSRPAVEPPKESSIPYKAVVFLVLKGGLDSFNMLVPGCNNLKSQYLSKRQQIALTDDQLLQINVSRDPIQPCMVFFLHHKLGEIQKSFNQRKTVFFANTGILNEKTNNTNYKTLAKLFAHNLMQKEVQRIDSPTTATATGILGRLMNVLHDMTDIDGNAYKVGSISIVDSSTALVGETGKSPVPITVKKRGSFVFDPYAWNKIKKWENVDLMPVIRSLNNATTFDSSLFNEAWSSDLLRSIEESRIIDNALSNAKITEKFSSFDYSEKLKQVASLIQTANLRGVNRDCFYVEFGGWDHHVDLTNLLSQRFEQLNSAVGEFWRELAYQGNEDKVALIAISEFARTLTPNTGDGTDHGWGGHYFMMGGDVKGGRILGEYPDLDGDLNVDKGQGRGRFIPTIAWEAIWNGISQWMGVKDNELLDEILPNRNKCGSVLFAKEDLFK